MVVMICEICQNRFAVAPDVTDYVHICVSGTNANVNSFEDQVVIGDWIDSTPDAGSKASTRNVFRQGIANAFWGQRAWVEGENIETFTPRGNRRQTTRTRRRLVYKDFRKGTEF